MLGKLTKDKPNTPNPSTTTTSSAPSSNLLSLLPPPPIVFLKKPPHNPPSHHLYLTEQSVPTEIKKVILQVEQEMSKNEIVEATELLRKGKEIAKFSRDRLLNSVIQLNLAICYYKIGLLEEAFQEMSMAQSGLKQFATLKKVPSPITLTSSNNQFYISLFNRIKLKRIRGRISLQVCILFSELAKHDLAMKYAKIGAKIHYNMIFDTLVLCYGIVLKYLHESKYCRKEVVELVEEEQNGNYIELPEVYDRIVNIIAILNYVIDMTKDLKSELLTKGKEVILNGQKEAIERYGNLRLEVDLDEFMDELTNGEWIIKNKILNQVQMDLVKREEYLESTAFQVTNNEVLLEITYLTVSFYCLSTEARFIQKNMPKAQSNIMDSQHWLSKSLELAYCLLPPEAPILGQIYSVHNKFHGIDKQPIPQDKQMQGCIKILRPLRRPKSTYNTKTTLCAPILIRIQTPKTLTNNESQKQGSSKQLRLDSKKKPIQNSVTIELDSTLKKNNRIRGVPKKLEFLNSLEKIYKNQLSKTQNPLRTIEVKRETSSLEKRRITSNEASRENSEEARRPHSNGMISNVNEEHFKVHKRKDFQSETIEVMQGLEQQPRLRKTKQKNVDIQINNNINLFITNQIGKPFEDNAFTIEYGKNQRREERGRKMVLKLVQGGPKDISKRSMFYGKRRGPNPFVGGETVLPEF